MIKMQKKRVYFTNNHKGQQVAQTMERTEAVDFDYGPLSGVPRFEGTHPAVMQEAIAALDWQDQLYEKAPAGRQSPRHKHESLKYRMLTGLENAFFGGRHQSRAPPPMNQRRFRTRLVCARQIDPGPVSPCIGVSESQV